MAGQTSFLVKIIHYGTGFVGRHSPRDDSFKGILRKNALAEGRSLRPVYGRPMEMTSKQITPSVGYHAKLEWPKDIIFGLNWLVD